ncbi:hypothetical protein [Streptomyces sp. NPDC059262]|uniref:hypothetical protein n=1 Tax=Streptomyces sp. NPDC059262 TaxID=3346797 RepID=UPI00368AA3C3
MSPTVSMTMLRLRPTIVALIRPGDTGSQNITRKLGMTQGHEFAHPKHGYPLQAHAIDLTEYEG